MPVLDVINVTAGYGDSEILKNISLSLEKGEIATIIGPNGAGKSTLLKTIFGLLKPRSGNIVLDGEDITRKSPVEIVKNGLSYVPQTENTFPSLTVKENLEMGAYIRKGGTTRRLREILSTFPALEPKQKTRARFLSGGEQKMLALGRTLMLDPSVLLIDEPSAGLAPTFVDTVLRKIQEINDKGTSIILVEQNARKSLKISHRGYVLDMGEKKFEGKGEELLTDPDVRKLYLGG